MDFVELVSELFILLEKVEVTGFFWLGCSVEFELERLPVVVGATFIILTNIIVLIISIGCSHYIESL
jgi:hypothetical protein